VAVLVQRVPQAELAVLLVLLLGQTLRRLLLLVVAVAVTLQRLVQQVAQAVVVVVQAVPLVLVQRHPFKVSTAVLAHLATVLVVVVLVRQATLMAHRLAATDFLRALQVQR
jgi:hypothetical protein